MLKLFLFSLIVFSQLSSSIKPESELLAYFLYEELSQLDNPDEIFSEVESRTKSLLNGEVSPLTRKQLRELLITVETNHAEKKRIKSFAEAEKFIKKIQIQPDVNEVVKDRVYYTIKKKTESILPKCVSESDQPLFHFHVKNIHGHTLLNAKERVFLENSIKGFALGVHGMQQGEKRVIYIHPDFSYGSSDFLSEPSLLIIEAELIEL